MRYFTIYADEKNLQPRFLNWYSRMGAGRTGRQIYENLEQQSYFEVELNREVLFPDVMSHPCFMVSQEFANLIRLYMPGLAFKYVYLFDKGNCRAAWYQVPDLPELECLDEKSELSKNRLEITKGILRAEKTEGCPVFRLGGTERPYILASLEFVESAYRREVNGMRIKEFMVEWEE